MPIQYSIDKASGVVFTSASGVLTDDDILQHKQRLTADPDFRPGMAELSDIREISKLDVSSNGIRTMVAQDASDASALEGFKLAIVVSRDLDFGMARMYEMMTSVSVPNVRVFRDLDEARTWLGLRT